jgi:hypothetical protein
MWSQMIGVATFCSTKFTKQTGHFSDSLLSQIRLAEEIYVEDVDGVDGVAAPPTSDLEPSQR